MANQSVKGNHASLAEFETKVASKVAIWREAEWDDMRVGYESYLSDFDDAELLKACPVIGVAALTSLHEGLVQHPLTYIDLAIS
jgi:hypothetical protein